MTGQQKKHFIAAAVIFEVDDWEGTLQTADPDNFILNVRFWPVPKAITLLEQTLTYPVMRDPLVAYLRGEVGPGASWFYRRRSDNHDELLFISKGST